MAWFRQLTLSADEVWVPSVQRAARNGLGGCILAGSKPRMGSYRHSQIVLSVAYCLLVFCMADFRPLLIGGFFKLVASLVLACLLAFVVVHSAKIWKLLIASLHALPVCFFPFAVDPRWAERWQTTVAVPNEPSLPALFQRPPPLSL
jgi:hypothetical protein